MTVHVQADVWQKFALPTRALVQGIKASGSIPFPSIYFISQSTILGRIRNIVPKDKPLYFTTQISRVQGPFPIISRYLGGRNFRKLKLEWPLVCQRCKDFLDVTGEGD
ncbi:hypothetical protein H2202_010155 [Exophiala xenobiotica]|nr:hypothetical protein H2202_010155 [Exophiala xenobiotica]